MKPKPFFDRSELTRHLWSFRKEFLWVGFFSMIANLLMLTPTLYMLQLYDRVLKGQSELTLIVVTLLMVFLYAIMVVAEWLRSRLLVRGGVRLDEAMNAIVFNASFEKNLKRAGANPSEAIGDLAVIRQFLTGNGIFAFFDTPWTPIYIAVIFLLNPFLGWVSVFFSIIQLVLAWYNHKATVDDIERSSKAVSESNAYFFSKLRNIEPVHAMGMTGSLRQRWLDLHEDALAQHGQAQHKQHRQQAFSKFVRYTMQSLTLGAGALMVIEGKMTTGGMIAANVLMSRALQPLDLLIVVWKPFIQARDAFFRLEKLFDDFPESPDKPSRPAPQGDVRIDALVATAPGRPEPILDGLDASFAAGTVTAIIGPSGSGKSTLARCLVGAWPEVSGGVLYDDEPIGSWDGEELGPHIGYLPQDIELFEGTIAENISRFGEADPARVIEAAQRTGIHEAILRFPNGYNSPIGEAGALLSGGQRQRVGLARAMYGNPSVLVLDEPNSNLDDAGEKALAQAIGQLKQSGKTVFLITHRLNILGAADRVLALRDGKIEHFGPREGVLEVVNAQEAARNGNAQTSGNQNGQGKQNGQ
ncbi:type I secretion system permease/ATPase [Chlorobaculum thiosulfatiphilum]|uniref:Type I secretion system permease/ATPase n=1 Tax=Chlorobaculum thiosulfatiphilum TaxID=115852 RepID=A0A5C4S047_CHLTI|nr:type I secretion system permease/ATPase [Chlorobaculum thiosulfatiphilum]TNJ36559.1 type I secretion system permease/ATPase [Chlorobaculum thiosulfatiphilum]